MFKPNEHERVFSIYPIGVKYICEHCNEGEMKSTGQQMIPLHMSVPMIKHYCIKCGCELLLPKAYPYIEWIPSGIERMPPEIERILEGDEQIPSGIKDTPSKGESI